MPPCFFEFPLESTFLHGPPPFHTLLSTLHIKKCLLRHGHFTVPYVNSRTNFPRITLALASPPTLHSLLSSYCPSTQEKFPESAHFRQRPFVQLLASLLSRPKLHWPAMIFVEHADFHPQTDQVALPIGDGLPISFPPFPTIPFFRPSVSRRVGKPKSGAYPEIQPPPYKPRCLQLQETVCLIDFLSPFFFPLIQGSITSQVTAPLPSGLRKEYGQRDHLPPLNPEDFLPFPPTSPPFLRVRNT